MTTFIVKTIILSFKIRRLAVSQLSKPHTQGCPCAILNVRNQFRLKILIKERKLQTQRNYSSLTEWHTQPKVPVYH